MKRDKIVIGSRESKLAVLQSEMVRDYIKEKNPDLEVEILTMKTTGDIILDRTLDKVGGKGLFVKELDKALIDGRSILSVHSLKYVNVASDREACDFYFPGVYMRDEMVVGVTASGLDHKKAKRVREEIQNALEKVLGEQDEDEER